MISYVQKIMFICQKLENIICKKLVNLGIQKNVGQEKKYIKIKLWNFKKFFFQYPETSKNIF